MTNPLCLAAALMALLTSTASHTNGATVEAKSAELADVKSAIASAREGDTVTVPAGTVNWASTLVITKSITLQGATSIGGSLSSPVVTDQTVILDEIPRPGRRQPLAREQQGRPQRPGGFSPGAGALRGRTRGASK